MELGSSADFRYRSSQPSPPDGPTGRVVGAGLRDETGDYIQDRPWVSCVGDWGEGGGCLSCRDIPDAVATPHVSISLSIEAFRTAGTCAV